MPIWKSQVFWRLFGIYGALLTIGLVLLGWLLWWWVEDRILSNVQQSLAAKSLLVEQLVDVRYDAAELQSYVGRWGAAAGLRLTLIASDGTVLADSMQSPTLMTNHSDRSEVKIAEASGLGIVTRYSESVSQKMLYVARKVERGTVKYIRVSMPLGEIERDIRWLRGLVITAVGLTMAIQLFASVLIASRFSGSLESDREELQAVLASMVEGVLVVDCDLRAKFFNDAAARMLTIPEDGKGKRLSELTQQLPLIEAAQEILSSESPCHRELSWNSPEPRVMMAHGARLHGHSPLGAVVVLHDVTDLRNLERIRRDFVSNVSHELKTPLAAIKANAETLLAGALEEPGHRTKFVRRIQESADRLHRLVLDLLSLGRIEGGREQFQIQSLSILEAVESCFGRHEQLADGRNVRLKLVQSESPVCVLADEEALGQILDNLVDNAMKYTSVGGDVEVSWRTKDNQVSIDVRDTGIGIAEKELSRIFERFYRVDRARSRELGGTGLGLSIVKHLAHALGGSVTAQSEINVGSTFTVTLPIT